MLYAYKNGDLNAYKRNICYNIIVFWLSAKKNGGEEEIESAKEEWA